MKRRHIIILTIIFCVLLSARSMADTNRKGKDSKDDIPVMTEGAQVDVVTSMPTQTIDDTETKITESPTISGTTIQEPWPSITSIVSPTDSVNVGEVATPSPTATSTPKPTATSTPKPTATSTPKPTATSTPKPTATSTPKPTATSTPIPTKAATPTPSAGESGDSVISGYQVNKLPYKVSGLTITKIEFGAWDTKVTVKNETGKAVGSLTYISYKCYDAEGSVLNSSNLYLEEVDSGESCVVSLYLPDGATRVIFGDASIR